mmetsp:Transcript_25066/g.75304  ORF Transcript_25066/g.75304 Transcript_25066/m.75304 type:complete len:112 (-) Transcript_25066:401-736(-)
MLSVIRCLMFRMFAKMSVLYNKFCLRCQVLQMFSEVAGCFKKFRIPVLLKCQLLWTLSKMSRAFAGPLVVGFSVVGSQIHRIRLHAFRRWRRPRLAVRDIRAMSVVVKLVN